MPTAGRDQRREQRIENAQRWKTWLTTAMAEARVDPKDIVNGSDGTIDKGSVSHWMSGDNSASPDAAFTVARILNRDPMEALTAAGHDVLAKGFAEAIERELLARLDALDKEREARLAKHKAAAEAVEGPTTNGATRSPGTAG